MEDGSMKQFLERLILAKSQRVVLRNNIKGKNRLIWSQFKIAYLDGMEQPYASCKYCHCLMKYTGRTGTGGLMRHFCFRQLCKSAEMQTKSHTPRLTTEQSATHVSASPLNSCPNSISPSDFSPVPNKPSLRSQIEVLMYHNSPRIGFMTNCKGKSEVWSQFHIITLDKEPVDFACCGICRNIVAYQSRTGTGSMTRHKCLAIRKQRLLPNILCKSKRTHSNYNYNYKVDDEGDKQMDSIKEEPPEQEPDPDEEADHEESQHHHDQLIRLPLHERSPLLNSLSEYIMDRSKPCNPPSPKQEISDVARDMEAVVRGKHLAFLRNSLSLLNISQNESFLQFAQALVDLGAKYGSVDVRNIFAGQVSISDLMQD